MSPARSPSGSSALPTRREANSSPSIRSVSFKVFSAHSAATPATCGVAMLVPLSERRLPPSGQADSTLTPGGTYICATIRESSYFKSIRTIGFSNRANRYEAIGSRGRCGGQSERRISSSTAFVTRCCDNDRTVGEERLLSCNGHREFVVQPHVRPIALECHVGCRFKSESPAAREEIADNPGSRFPATLRSHSLPRGRPSESRRQSNWSRHRRHRALFRSTIDVTPGATPMRTSGKITTHGPSTVSTVSVAIAVAFAGEVFLDHSFSGKSSMIRVNPGVEHSDG